MNPGTTNLKSWLADKGLQRDNDFLMIKTA